MAYGWMGNILDVNLTTGQIAMRDTMAYAHDDIGGRGMAARIAWESIPAGTDAYDPANCVVIATGPLSGTLAPTTGRTVMAGVAPRPYPKPWYTHSTLGGWFGPELKYAGFDAIILRGRANAPVALEIRDGVARLVDAAPLWGLDARQTQLTLRRTMDPRAQVLTIGPAGENLVRFASVQHAEENAAGHSGFGAVWGSKRLKAIVVRGTGSVAVAHPDRLLNEVLAAGVFRLSPSASAARRDPHTEGCEQLPVCSQACTFDCRVAGVSREGGDGRRVPGFCIGNLYVRNTGMSGTAYQGGGIVVPPSPSFGLVEERAFHELCNALGLDLWFRLVVQPWMIRCRQLGVETLRGHRLEPEDSGWFLRFTTQVAAREGLGALFADDLRRAMDELEGELPDELIRLGHELEFDFGFPAHREGRFWDEEPLPFWAISAMMHCSEGRDPTIGAHQSSLHLEGFMMADREAAIRQFRRLSEDVWGDSQALAPTLERKATAALWSQDQHMLIDSLPLCDFAFPQLVRSLRIDEDWRTVEHLVGDLDIDLRLLNAVTGGDWTRDRLTRASRRAIAIERVLLAREGRCRQMEEELLASHFALPCRADGTAVDAAGLRALMDDYYAARGYDLITGWPTPELWRELGLGSAEALETLHAQGAGGAWRG